MIIRGKWLMDGAKTLEEAATMLEEEARRLRKLAKEDLELDGPVVDDYGYLKKNTKA